MSSKKNYESPVVQRDELFQVDRICATSGGNEEFVDNNGIVDWFETTQN